MKMKVITPAVIKQLRPEIDAALEALAKKYDVSLKAGNASYTSETIVYKLELTTKGEGGVIENCTWI